MLLNYTTTVFEHCLLCFPLWFCCQTNTFSANHTTISAMDRELLFNIGRTYLKLCNRLDRNVFLGIRRLGIGRHPPTRRGTRAGRLHRKWHGLSPTSSCTTPHVEHAREPPTYARGDLCSTHHATSAAAVGAVNTPLSITPASTEVCATLHTPVNFLKIMYLNAQSCGNKALELADTITDEKSDIVFLSETWLKNVGDEPKLTELTPIGFLLKNVPRLTGRGGGLAILYREGLRRKLHIHPDCSSFSTFDMCEVRLHYHRRTVTFVFLYRPPPSKRNKLTATTFVSEFQDLLDRYNSTKDLIIIGDVNLHFDCNSETYSVMLKKTLKDYALKQLVNVPTHVRGHTLDWLITNACELVVDLNVHDRCLSDHFLISFNLPLSKPRQLRKSVISRNLRAIDIATFRSDVAAMLSRSSATDLYTRYITCLRGLLDSHAPLTSRSVTDRPSAPWMSYEIKRAKRLRRCAERRYRKTGLAVHREIFVREKNRANQMVRDAKTMHLCDRIKSADSSRELFRVTAEMLGGSGRPILPSSIPTADLPDTFNRFFIDRIAQIRQGMPKSSRIDSDPIFEGSPLSEFHCVSEVFVRDLIGKMPRTSCDLDPIPASLFNDCVAELVPTITMIMNDSLTTGIVPLPFKHALVRPILKKADLDPEGLKNYRPISNLPFLSKVLERIVLAQLLTHLGTFGLLEEFQSAYKKFHSTETALIKIVSDLLSRSDSGQVSILAMLDLSAAFDTLDHDILINRLAVTFGCSGLVLSWFKSYLSERTQSVTIDGSVSSRLALGFGVPQGSVLGPLLFTMYIYPLGHVIRPSGISYHFYADDSQLYDSSVPADVPRLAAQVSRAIFSVCSWMIDNGLKMNDDKTEVLLIGTNKRMAQVEGPTALTVLDCQVPFVDKIKNLGVLLDSTLSFDAHISNLCKGLYLQLRRIGQIRPYLSTDSAKKLVVALILSRLDYCNALLAGLPEDKISKLQRIQNSAARLVMRRSRSDSVSALLHLLHWLPVKARIDYKIATLCHQCLHNQNMPTYLRGLISPYVPPRALRSADSSTLVVPRFSLQTYGMRAFSSFGPKVWNSLPIQLRQTACFDTFKKKLKTYYFKIHR